MDIAYEIATYLASAGFGTVNTNIFIGQIPAQTDGIFIVRSGGDNNLYVPIERVMLDIYYKSMTSQTAVTTLEDIKRFVHRMHTTQTANTVIYSIVAIGDVEQISRDEEYYKLYKLSIEVMFRDTNLIS